MIKTFLFIVFTGTSHPLPNPPPMGEGTNDVRRTAQNLDESLQDTSTYDSKQKSMGGSLSVAIIGTGTGGSVNAANTNINSNYASVMEQSGIKAGDGGYSVKVKGNTDLKGAAIAASDEGLKLASFSTGGTLTQSDIHNSASYNAESYAVSLGTSAGSTSAGMGVDSGNASSTTKSGIGVSTKTDTTGAIAKIFDANKVTEEVTAQAEITKTFSQQAPKAVANYAETKTKPYTDATAYLALSDKKQQGGLSEAETKQLADLDKLEMTHDKAQAITLKDSPAQKDYDNWKEGGIARATLHTLSGALSFGVNGALGAAASANAAPLLDEMQTNMQVALAKHMSPEAAKIVAQGIANLTSAGMGYAVGGVQGAGTALTVDANNRQLHVSEIEKLRRLAKSWAASKGITYAVAEERLSAQALRQVDDEFRKGHPGQDDEARSLLMSNSDFFYDERGVPTKLFTASSKDDFKNSSLYANTKTQFPDLYANANSRQERDVPPKGMAAVKEISIGTVKGIANTPGGLVNLAITSGEGLYNLGGLIFGNDYELLPKVPNLWEYSTPGEAVAGELGPTALGPFLPVASSSLSQMFMRTSVKGEGSYGELRGNLDSGYQAHHLNQNAAFNKVIPQDEGFAIGIRGNAFTETGTPHYEFHSSMESFLDTYRKGGELFGEVPTCAQYGCAVTDALKNAGIGTSESQRLSNLAARNREVFGLTPSDLIPRVPRKMYQSGGK